jgi:hypothetical protein
MEHKETNNNAKYRIKLHLGISSNTWCAQTFLKRTRLYDNPNNPKNYTRKARKPTAAYKYRDKA